MSEHNPDHRKEINRIQRIIGQLEGIKKMINEGRYCPDILVQTKAVTSAVRSLEASILEKHLKHCVMSAMESNDRELVAEKTKELIEIFQKRLP